MLFYNTDEIKIWAASASGYRCCPLFLTDRMKESDFLLLFVGCVLLHLFQILADRVHTGFDFPELMRSCPDGFELDIGFLMLLL